MRLRPMPLHTQRRLGWLPHVAVPLTGQSPAAFAEALERNNQRLKAEILGDRLGGSFMKRKGQ